MNASVAATLKPRRRSHSPDVHGEYVPTDEFMPRVTVAGETVDALRRTDHVRTGFIRSAVLDEAQQEQFYLSTAENTYGGDAAPAAVCARTAPARSILPSRASCRVWHADRVRTCTWDDREGSGGARKSPASAWIVTLKWRSFESPWNSAREGQGKT